MAHRKPRVRSGVVRVAVVAALMGLVISPLGAAGKEHARQLETPSVSDLRFGYGAEDRDDEVDFGRGSEPRPTTRAFRVASGEEVRIGVSPAYSFDDARLQAWADFIGSLLHGSELATVSFYFAPPSEIAEACGPHAAACYWALVPPMIFTPGEDVPGLGLTAEAILAHEYGHHVSNSRPNPPWGALLYGTKRWASYVNVCAAVLAGQYFPGDGGEHYALNPSEGLCRGLPSRQPAKTRRPRGTMAPRRPSLLSRCDRRCADRAGRRRSLGGAHQRLISRAVYPGWPESVDVRCLDSSRRNRDSQRASAQGSALPREPDDVDGLRAANDLLHRATRQGLREVRTRRIATLTLR